MKFDLEQISDQNGNVDPDKLKKWLNEGDSEGRETPEMAQKICKAIGYDNGRAMNAEDFARKYVFAKIFIDLDKDKSGFLNKNEFKGYIDKNDESSKEFKEAFAKFDLNSDGQISIDEFLNILEESFSNL